MSITQSASTPAIRIELDSKLKLIQPSSWALEREYGIDHITETLESTLRCECKRVTFENLSSHGRSFHLGYLNYLEQCWSYHRWAVLTPDIMWQAVLCELASAVRDDPEKFRSVFTVSAEKIEIIVDGDAEREPLPVQAVVARLKEYVPTSVDDLLPVFTTTDERSRMAHCSAFCDAVSPFYNYGMMLCGIPGVVVRGTAADYALLLSSWEKLPLILRVDFLHIWRLLGDLAAAVSAPESEDARAFFQRIFSAKKCGSGHQVEIDGWMARLRRKQPKSLRYASNFDPHVSRVDYKQIETGKKYSLLSGVLGSDVSPDGVAEPVFASMAFAL